MVKEEKDCVITRLWQRLFHRCGENLEYINGTRFPKTGTTGRDKVWKNYGQKTFLAIFKTDLKS